MSLRIGSLGSRCSRTSVEDRSRRHQPTSGRPASISCTTASTRARGRRSQAGEGRRGGVGVSRRRVGGSLRPGGCRRRGEVRSSLHGAAMEVIDSTFPWGVFEGDEENKVISFARECERAESCDLAVLLVSQGHAVACDNRRSVLEALAEHFAAANIPCLVYASPGATAHAYNSKQRKGFQRDVVERLYRFEPERLGPLTYLRVVEAPSNSAPGPRPPDDDLVVGQRQPVQPAGAGAGCLERQPARRPREHRPRDVGVHPGLLLRARRQPLAVVASGRHLRPQRRAPPPSLHVRRGYGRGRCRGTRLPFTWDGTVEGLPSGWDEVLEVGTSARRQVRPRRRTPSRR